MSIIKKVKAKKAELLKEKEQIGKTPNQPVKALKNRDKAVAALLGGMGSDAWKIYMQQFADTPAELKRLMGTDKTAGNHEFDIKRAYVVANAICGAGTTTDLDRQVDTIDH